MAKKVLWIFGVHENSGYASNSRCFIRALNQNGVETRFRSHGLQEYPHRDVMQKYEEPEGYDPDIVVWNILPIFFKPELFPGKKNILMTFAETDRVMPDWVAPCNKADELWTQSYFSKSAFLFSGVTVPIFVAHTPTDVESILAANERYFKVRFLTEEKPRFVFLANSEWTPRKGWDILIKAFFSAFSQYPNVMLLIKTLSLSGMENINSIAGTLRLMKAQAKAKCSVCVICEAVPISKVWTLYKQANAFVLPSRGEAGGIGYMEAMASGLPVICPSKGGQVDYINQSSAYTVDSKLVRASRMPHNRFYDETMNWVETDPLKLADTMMTVMACYDKERYQRGHEIFKSDFGFNGTKIKHIAKRISEEL